MLLSKVPYYINLSSLLAQGHLYASHYLRLDLLSSDCYTSLRFYYVQATCNMNSLCFTTPSSLAQGQIPDRFEFSSCFTLNQQNSPLRRRIPCILCTSPIWGVAVGWAKSINLLIVSPMINSSSHGLSHPSHSLYSNFYSKEGSPLLELLLFYVLVTWHQYPFNNNCKRTELDIWKTAVSEFCSQAVRRQALGFKSNFPSRFSVTLACSQKQLPFDSWGQTNNSPLIIFLYIILEIFFLVKTTYFWLNIF